MTRRSTRLLIALFFVILTAFLLFACVPYSEAVTDKYPIEHDSEDNQKLQYPPQSPGEKDRLVDQAMDGMDNLLGHLNSAETSDTGYYVGADITINTFDAIPSERSAFRLKLRANLYTYPYEILDEYGEPVLDENGQPMVDEEALAKHNEYIKYNDIILEWYDAINNEMLIGFYFDGINPNSAKPGNNLYLNLLGSKRIFLDFGDSVLYQQIVRLITKFNINNMLDGDSQTDGSTLSELRELLKFAVTNNYKEVRNGDVTSIFFYDVDLGGSSNGIVTERLTQYMQGFFKPFENKLDPLTNKYLGFKFSTLGEATITSLVTSMQFFLSTPKQDLGEIMTGLVVDASGVAQVIKPRGQEAVNYTSRISFDYSLRIATDIVIDDTGYTVYEYGNYEYVGDLYIPFLNLKADALVRLDVNEYDEKKGLDNSTNRVFAQFYDKSNNDVLIGLYYANEKTYIDIQNLKDLYGGIQFEDIGLPKAYAEGFDLAQLLTVLFDTVDIYIELMVTSLLSPGGENENYDALTAAIMANIESTMIDPDVPSSRNTIRLRIDMELIRTILRETSENGTDYTNKQIISLINEMFGIDVESIAAILGMNVETLMQTTFFHITYDVDEYSIKFEIFNSQNNPEGDLILRLDLFPTKIGEAVRISFPSFDDFKPLQKVMTYSGYMEGQIIFAATEEVNISDLMGAFIGDLSGLNTPFILPEAASIYFTLYYDQYIRDQILANNRWTRAGRSAFQMHFFIIENNVPVDLFWVYANDVSFDTSDPVEELGYVWVELTCVPGMPRMKVREDLFLESFSLYMGLEVSDDAAITVGLTTILQALMEDSWLAFEPEVIRITTSNQTIKDFFRVDELIGTISAQIGFKQRVFNIDELESSFAMYTVSELPDISGPSPYEIKLHDTITVYFDFGDRMEQKEFLFNYNPDSVRVVTNTINYYPTLDGLFMGAVRTYHVNITTLGKGTAAIIELAVKHYDWEPLNTTFPRMVEAFYGANTTADYPADFNFYAYYDRTLGYYIVANDLDYHILYDAAHETYIVGLNGNYKYDKADEWLLRDGKTVMHKTFTDINDYEYSYLLNSELYGYYIVKNERINMLYNIIGGYYVIENQGDMSDARIIAGDDAVIYCMTGFTIDGFDMSFDLKTGYYATVASNLSLVYNHHGVYYVESDEARDLAIALFGLPNVALAPEIDFTELDIDGDNWSGIDWVENFYKDIVWGKADWDTMTLEGGLFIVEVIIGKGMMATYRELITARVYNRTVDTDRYINANVYNEETGEGDRIRVPVVDEIEVDPYTYILLQADYHNNLSETLSQQEMMDSFATWLFYHYMVKIDFTKIYNNENDTPREQNRFEWEFEYNGDGKNSYGEQNIHNAVSEGTYQTTYVITNFRGQIVALSLVVLPRNIDYIKYDEEAPGQYTVDALMETTYKIPTDPVVYFKETASDGSPLTLDFTDYSPARSTIFEASPVQISGTDVRIPTSKLPPQTTPLNSVINWGDPEANNVKLINTQPDGKVYPFKGKSTNVTSSFINLQYYTDPGKVWFKDDWFNTPIVEVEVLMPDKIVKDIVYDGAEYPNGPYTVKNVMLAGNSLPGQFNVDPFSKDTWILPNEILVYFNEEAPYIEKKYEVKWETGANVAENNGVYSIINIDAGPTNHFIISTLIGDKASGNYIDIDVLVVKLSGEIECIDFLDRNGAHIAGSLTEEPWYDHGGAMLSYVYEVDTYTRFEMPAYGVFKFKDGTERKYPIAFNYYPPYWVPGSVLTVSAELGDGIPQEIPLTVFVTNRTITAIELCDANNYAFTAYDIAYDILGRKITVENLDFTQGGKLEGLNPFEFFLYLFDNIHITLSPKTTPPQVEADFPNDLYIRDALSFEMLNILLSFDSQKMLSGGQQFTINLGQGPQAHDFAVTIEIKGIRVISDGANSDGADNENGVISIEPFDPDTNQPNYGPDGAKEKYVFSEEIQIRIFYGDGGEAVFGRDGLELPYPWYVGKPQGVAEDASGMAGIEEGSEIDSLDWDAIQTGGYVWITTMLPDGSRVYRKLTIAFINIGSSFSSPSDDPSPFKIVNGVITIETIYAFYPLSVSLIASALPQRITVSNGNITINIKEWIMLVDSVTLGSFDHTTDIPESAQYQLAKTTVVGSELIVYLIIKPSVANNVSYTDPLNATKNFASSRNAGRIEVAFDAYANNGYNCNFTLPQNLNITFASGVKYEFNNISYRYTNIVGQLNPLTAIPYNYSGHLMSNMASGNEVLLTVMLSDNQKVEILVIFLNKTVTDISVENDPNRGVYYLDPYGGIRDVANRIVIHFAEGADYSYAINEWNKPSNFEVKYDTFRRLLAPAGGYFEFTSQLTVGNLTVQPLRLEVVVYDRVMDSWSVVAPLFDTVLTMDNPAASYHYTDPFAGRVTDLPARVLDSSGGVNVPGIAAISSLDIVWIFANSDISAEGTAGSTDIYGKYGRVINGYLKDSAYGQRITLRVYINRWEFEGIRRPLGDDWQIMNEDIRFFFSVLTNASAYDKYQIIIRQLDPTATGGSRLTESNINVVFYPEDVTPPTSEGYDYRIRWDATAKGIALTSIQATGRFYLANNLGIKISPLNVVYYQYERPNISMLDLGYGRDTANNVMYVLNPLDLRFTQTGDAYGTLNQEFDVYLGKAEIIWNNTEFSSVYLKGGVYRGYTVTVRLVYGSYEHEQSFQVVLVFLDMSPSDSITVHSGTGYEVPFSLKSHVKTHYETNTYAGVTNPYRDSYTAKLIDALNKGVSALLPLDSDDEYKIDITIVEYERLVENFPPTVIQPLTIYSKTIEINGKRYSSDIVKFIILP